MPVYLVIVAALVVIGLGLGGNLTAPVKDGTTSSLPPASAPVATAPPRAARTMTPAPSLAPTLAPTLAPMVAAVTTAGLAPTGAHVADLDDPAIGNPVADVDGTIWAEHAGGVVNVDPRTGRTREWTLADDPAFATASLAPARQGGVWLVTQEALRLFDGERFRAVIDTPEPVWLMVEGADGTLWAQTDRYGLVRWADGTWTSDRPGRPVRGAAEIVVDGEGRVWTIDAYRQADGGWIPSGVSVWDGSAWTSFTSADLPVTATAESSIPSLIASGDGTVWVALGRQVARLGAGGWTLREVPEIGVSASLSAVGDDGRLWLVGEDCGSCGVRIQVYDGSALTTYDEDDGLPGADEVGPLWATVLPGPGYVLAATEAGLYSLADGSWQRLRTSTSSGAPTPGAPRSGEVTELTASSRDEVWVTTRPAEWEAGPGDGGLFAYDGSAWHREQQPAGTAVGQAVVGPDGALWVATGSGPLVRRNGAWTDLGETVAAVVPEPGEAADGCGGVVFMGDGGAVYYAGSRSANRLVRLRLAGGAWEPSLHPAPLVDPGISSLACSDTFAVTADGTIWRLQRGWGSDLSRWTDGRWQQVSLSETNGPDVHLDPSAIVADGEGSLWVAVNTWDPVFETVRADVLQLVAGRWTWRGGGDGIFVVALALLPDGSPVAVGDGVARLRGQRWQRLWHGLWLSDVSVAPDGAVWVSGSNVYRLPPGLP